MSDDTGIAIEDLAAVEAPPRPNNGGSSNLPTPIPYR